MNITPATFAPYSLAVFLDSAEVADATTAIGSRRSVRVEEPVVRSYIGQSAWTFKGEGISTIQNVDDGLLIGADRAEDQIVADVSQYLDLGAGWDGESAAKPNARAVLDAVRFLRSVGSVAAKLEPTLDVDGSVILEPSDETALCFKGDGTIVYTSPSSPPGKAAFDGYVIPTAIQQLLYV